MSDLIRFAGYMMKFKSSPTDLFKAAEKYPVRASIFERFLNNGIFCGGEEYLRWPCVWCEPRFIAISIVNINKKILVCRYHELRFVGRRT